MRESARLSVDEEMHAVFAEFTGEGPQLVQALEACLLELSGGGAGDLVSARRTLHTLKGILDFLGLPQAAGLCHQAEDHLEAYRGAGITPPPALIDWLLGLARALDAQVASIAAGLESGSVAVLDFGDLAPAP